MNLNYCFHPILSAGIEIETRRWLNLSKVHIFFLSSFCCRYRPASNNNKLMDARGKSKGILLSLVLFFLLWPTTLFVNDLNNYPVGGGGASLKKRLPIQGCLMIEGNKKEKIKLNEWQRLAMVNSIGQWGQQMLILWNVFPWFLKDFRKRKNIFNTSRFSFNDLFDQLDGNTLVLDFTTPGLDNQCLVIKRVLSFLGEKKEKQWGKFIDPWELLRDCLGKIIKGPSADIALRVSGWW